MTIESSSAMELGSTATADENQDPRAILRSASFVTRDPDRTVDFYTNLLGYEVLG